MRLNVYCSFEPALLERVLRFWNERVPRFETLEVHPPAMLPWGLRSDSDADEVRAFLLDPAGVRAALAESLAPVFRAGGAGRPPLVALLPDRAGMPDAGALSRSRAEMLDVTRAASAAGVLEILDPESEKLAGVPYTDDALLAAGTAVFRGATAVVTPAPKVLAIDCDGTLWRGLCAEDGTRGIRIGPNERRLHALLLEQKRAGRLLVLVSKNVPEDVEAVFRDRDDLGIRWLDLAATRIGWGAKSAALRELADGLNLGLDSFVFLDDSPAECAEVRAACGDVAVLQWPQRDAGRFLDAAWCLDPRRGDTALGEERTRLYQEDARRRAAMSEAPAFADHVAFLEVRTTVRLATPADEGRIFELAQRTNQFHTAADRPTGSDVHERLARGGLAVVTVTDRFGDYGLSGAAFFERDRGTLRVDRLLLSCRVLGRGVEEDVFDALVALARSEGLEALSVAFATTARNTPARQFLAAVAERLGADPAGHDSGDGSWRFVVAGLPACPRLLAREPAAQASRVRGAEAPDWTAVAELTRDVAALAAALGISRVPLEAPTARGDEGILQVAAEVLGRPVSKGDNLYALGADSLKIVRLLARLKSRLGLELPIGEVLHRANVADLLLLGQRAGTGSRPEEPDFFDQVQSLYQDDPPPR